MMGRQEHWSEVVVPVKESSLLVWVLSGLVAVLEF